jgi:hypothetical protein
VDNTYSVAYWSAKSFGFVFKDRKEKNVFLFFSSCSFIVLEECKSLNFEHLLELFAFFWHFINKNMNTEQNFDLDEGGGIDEDTETENEGDTQQVTNNNTRTNNTNSNHNSNNNNNNNTADNPPVVNWVIANNNTYADIPWDSVHVPKIDWASLVPMSEAWYVYQNYLVQEFRSEHPLCKIKDFVITPYGIFCFFCSRISINEIAAFSKPPGVVLGMRELQSHVAADHHKKNAFV